jgi:hypothetical protein
VLRLISFVCNWQSDILLRRNEWTRHVLTRRGRIGTLRRMIQNLEVQLQDSPAEVKGERAVRTKQYVRISHRGRGTYIRSGSTFHRFRYEGDVFDYVFLISSRPHLIPLKPLEACKTIPLHPLSLRYSLFACYLNFIVVFTIASKSSSILNLSLTSHRISLRSL